MPSAMSRPIDPVEMAAMSSVGVEPSFMIEPLPKLRSICASADFERLLFVHSASFVQVEDRGRHVSPLIPQLQGAGNRANVRVLFLFATWAQNTNNATGIFEKVNGNGPAGASRLKMVFDALGQFVEGEGLGHEGCVRNSELAADESVLGIA